MAHQETVVRSIRERCTRVFEALQRDLDPVAEDKDDFIDELGLAWFADWFADPATNYDVSLQQMTEAVQAMQTLKQAFEAVRPKLQVVRLR